MGKIVLLAIFGIIHGIFAFFSKNEDKVNIKEAKLPENFQGKMFAGYLNVSDEKQFYYWFFEKEEEPEKAPVLLWLNGGPGCSSLNGAVFEIGPFLFNNFELGFNSTLNEYSWHKLTNLLFLESPGGVGFSIGPNAGPITDLQVGKDNKEALLSFFSKFPEYKENEFYIAGESYAGIYVPYTAFSIHEENKKEKRINLKGWAVGNACTHPSECTDSQMKFTNDSIFLFSFLEGQNKISSETIREFWKVCDSFPNGNDCKQIREKIQIESGLLTKNESIGAYIDQYNIYAYCNHETEKTQKSTFSPFRKYFRNEDSTISNKLIPGCSDMAAAMNYFHDSNVLKALHVKEKSLKWDSCSDNVGNRTKMDLRASYWIYKELIGQYRILIYSGDVDSVVPITGSLFWVELLQKEIGLTPKMSWRPWFYFVKSGNSLEKQVGGMALEFDRNFSFVSVRGAGHMVPQYTPDKAFQMLHSFIKGDGFNENQIKNLSE